MSNDYGKVRAILKYLKIDLRNPIEDEHFRDRLIIQKLVFISKFLGIGLNYSFGLYKKGPYSPTLTDDYYSYHENDPPLVYKFGTIPSLNMGESRILEKMKDVIFSHPIYKTHKLDLLQAISTILYFRMKEPNSSVDQLVYNTKTEKPYLTERIVTIAMNLVKILKF